MKKPATPRPSATMLILRDDPFEVLMVVRHADQDFSSAMVFPGGLVDLADSDPAWLPHITGADGLSDLERALRIAAMRETFEETGLFLGRGRDGQWLDTVEAAGSFLDTVARAGAVLDLGQLVHFGHWITPELALRRYDTHFFLAAAPGGQIACCDGREAVEAVWLEPTVVLQQAQTGQRDLPFPTRLNVRRLAGSDTLADAMAKAAERTVFTVLPHMERRPGGVRVTIPEEAGYDETEEFRPL